VENTEFSQLPERLLEYYDDTFLIELRTLYEDGEVSRRQWSFRDEAGKVRLVSVFTDDGSGFLEFFTPEELILESHQINGEGSDLYNLYKYNESVLVNVETWRFTPARVPEEADSEGDGAAAADAEGAGDTPLTAEPPALIAETSVVTAEPADESVIADDSAIADDSENEPVDETVDRTELLWTDYYRYNRSRSLRSVERRFSKVTDGGEPSTFLQFPRLSLSTVNNEFVSPASVLSSEFFDDVILNSGDRILYTTDSRGRVISEVRRDASDKVLGEIINTWSGDRLTSIFWKAEEEERLIEYEYNADGDRIAERNIRNGVLERVVRMDGNREVEELYINGEIMLRALWEDGRKISEERVRRGGQTPAAGVE
jgi:hypothetical protein